MRKYKVELEVESDAVIGEGDVEVWEKNEIKGMFEARFTNPNYTVGFLSVPGMITEIRVIGIEKKLK